MKTAQQRINEYKKRNPNGKLSKEIFDLKKENKELKLRLENIEYDIQLIWNK